MGISRNSNMSGALSQNKEKEEKKAQKNAVVSSNEAKKI
jgi:hypothetical protein